jgi:hypothetical protein
MRNRIFWALSFLAVVKLLSCGPAPTVAGAGVETTNSFAVSAVYRTGEPASNVVARLRNAHYLPDNGGAESVSTDRFTDAQGAVTFDSLEPGAYTLELTDQAGQSLVVRCTLAIDTGHIELGTDTLDPDGSVTGVVRVEGSSDHGARIRVYGLEKTTRAGSDGQFVLDHMPRGTFRMQIIPDQSRDKVELPEIDVQAGDTVSTDTLRIEHGCTDFPCDSLMVRQILDTNGLIDVAVDSVAVTIDGRIRGLYLEGRDSLVLTPAIGQLTALEKLSFRRSKLTSLPENIGNLISLVRLDLFNTGIATLPASLSQCTSLRHIGLGACGISEIPSAVYAVRGLKELALSVNGIETLEPRFFTLTRLTQIQLFHNNLTALPPDIQKLTNLEKILLGQNNLTTLPLEIMSLPRVRGIGVQGNALCSLPDTMRTWLDGFDPGWESAQDCK